MKPFRILSLALGLALVSYAPSASAISSYYSSMCSSCHGSTPTTCNGCHKHGGNNVAGSISKTSFAPGENVNLTVTAGTRTGWWRAAVLDQSNRVLTTASVASGTTATLTVPAPTTAGTYAWKVAWYGNQYDSSAPGAGFVPDPTNPSHGYQTVAVSPFTVAAAAAPTIALAPGSLNFGNVDVGATRSLAAQVQNTGNAPLTITAIARCASPATSAEYGWSPTALPVTVSPGASATLNVTYAPTASGADTGCLALTSNASNAPTTNLAVSGTGVVPAAPRIAVSPTSLIFGDVTAGSSTPRTFTVSNTGSATLTGTVARASGTSAEYAVSPTSLSVAPGANQVVTVTYAPAGTGADAGSITLTSNDASSPSVSVSVSGNGVAAPAPNASLSPTALSFGTVTVGGSASLTAQVRNTGTAPLNVTQIARCASPATSAEFTWSPAAPLSVAAGGSTTVTVTYTPSAGGADAGCLAFSTDDAANPIVSLDVSGTGQLPAAPRIALSPTSLAFGNVTAGTSTQRTLTVSNTGTATLTGTVARASGTSAEYAVSPASFNVAPGASQAVTVTYAPVDVGTDGGGLVVTSNDAAAPSSSVTVTGSGVAAPTPAIALSPSALSFGSVVVGSSGTLTAQVRNTGTARLDVTALAPCAGTSAAFGWAPAAPLSVAPGATATLTVTYRPSAAAADSGCVAVSSNDPASPTVNLGLSGQGVAAAVPAIALEPAALDFGTVLVGASAARTTLIKNTGTGALDVTRIALCSGTPAGFTWSPAAPLSVAPGASVTVTATYAPTAAAAEAGCLRIESNDAARSAIELAVAGAGATPPVPSVDADLDVADLKIPGRFKTELRPLRPTVVLVNRSAIAGTGTATLTGVLAGVQVYGATIDVALPAGATGDFAFPTYVPPDVRDAIAWKLTVADQDPDVDEATARTVIAYRRDGAARLVDVVTASSALEGEAAEGGGCSSGAGGAGFMSLLALGLGLAAARRRWRSSPTRG